MSGASVLDRIEVVEGDITALDCDAIVNAANTRLLPGGGVCGAIHRAAGPELAEACDRIYRCPTGEARITPGFRLRARWVIHAVGPGWNGGTAGEDRLLASAYRESLRLAAEHGLRSVAFPAISTGTYGFPFEQATAIAARTVYDMLLISPLPERVFLVFRGAEAAETGRAALRDLAVEVEDRHD
jgi:O-acetyl-ADP-ribose deacetylase (regulator of RNase III)